MQLQYFMALEIARERVREAEARARLRWGVEPETPLGRRIAARLASLARFVSRTALSRHVQGRGLEAAMMEQPSGRVPA